MSQQGDKLEQIDRVELHCFRGGDRLPFVTWVAAFDAREWELNPNPETRFALFEARVREGIYGLATAVLREKT